MPSLTRAAWAAVAALAATLATAPRPAVAAPFVSKEAPEDKSRFAVVGYLPEYRLRGFDYEEAFAAGVTHIIFFSMEVGSDGMPDATDRLPSEAIMKEARKAADRHGGRLIIGIGGHGRSRHFGRMVTSRRLRRDFLGEMEKILRTNEFDGVDYNWEYPRNEAEWDGWRRLLRESKSRLLRWRRRESNMKRRKMKEGLLKKHIIDRYYRLNNRTKKAYVSFTIYNDPRHFQVVRKLELYNFTDHIHVMAYDQPGHHSTVPFAATALEHSKTHFPEKYRQKVTLGLPFYARHTKTGEAEVYAAFAKDLADDSASDSVGDMYFNGRDTIAKKVRLAAEGGAGGVMLWELGQDVQPLSAPHSLTSAVRSAVPTEPLPGADEELIRGADSVPKEERRDWEADAESAFADVPGAGEAPEEDDTMRIVKDGEKGDEEVEEGTTVKHIAIDPEKMESSTPGAGKAAPQRLNEDL